jgi:hypothetical protein
VPPLAPDAMFPAGAQCFWPSRTFVAEVQPSVPSAPKAGTASKDYPCEQNSRDMSSISVSVKPIIRKSLRVTETARELKSSAWPDVGEAPKPRAN